MNAFPRDRKKDRKLENLLIIIVCFLFSYSFFYLWKGSAVEEDVQKQVMGPVFPFYLGPACFDVFSPQTLPGKVVQVTVRERE
jgi:hypothetical protein